MLVKGSVEDFLYILVGVIWIAFSLYKGIKKKNAQKQQTQETFDAEPEPEKKKSAFETFMDQIMDQEEPAQQQDVVFESGAEPLDEIENEDKSKVFSYDDYYEESNYEKNIEVYSEAVTQSIELKNQLQTPLKKSRKPRFDLRKAVIYSEILNRRYF